MNKGHIGGQKEEIKSQQSNLQGVYENAVQAVLEIKEQFKNASFTDEWACLAEDLVKHHTQRKSTSVLGGLLDIDSRSLQASRNWSARMRMCLLI